MSVAVEKSPRVVLLLGAGASVAAGVPTTIQFVDEFLKAHTDDESLQGLVATLQEKDPNTDVEALLRVLHSLSRRESVPESLFLQPIKGLASSEQLVKWRDSLESYIRQRCFVDPSAVTYLEPLRQLVANYEGPLDIFTVNYDTAVEVFCLTRDLRFNNGLRGSWQPELLQETDADVRLYKIHGSVTWWSTDQGTLVEIPVKIEDPETQLYYGARARTLIIYPYEAAKEAPTPVVDLLPLLRERLLAADILVVVGYSFRDNEIRTIVLDSMRVNKHLATVLIGPSAHRVYEEKLRFLGPDVASSAVDRTSCLPFTFEGVFPRLQDEHLRNLLDGLRRYHEMLDSEVKWGQLLAPAQYGYQCVALTRGGLTELAWKLIQQKFPLSWPLEWHLRSVILTAAFAALGKVPEIVAEMGTVVDVLRQRVESSAKVVSDGTSIQLLFVTSGVGEGSTTQNNASSFADWVDDLCRTVERYAQASRHGVGAIRDDAHLDGLHRGLQAIQLYLLSNWIQAIPSPGDKHLSRWRANGVNLDSGLGTEKLAKRLAAEPALSSAVSREEGKEIAVHLVWGNSPGV